MPVYGIEACLGNVSCELQFHTLTKINELGSRLEQVEIVAKGLLVGFLGLMAVMLAWKFLKTVF